MSFVSSIKPYKTVKVEAFGGGNVKIKVKRDLLTPAGKEIIATLQFNGTKVYIPKDRDITIGRAPGCDILIKDPAIDPRHLIITVGDKGVLLHTLAQEKNIGVGDLKTKEPTILSFGDGDWSVKNDAIITLRLNGVNRFLNINLNIPEEADEALKTTIALQLAAPKPKVETVSVEQALAKRDKQVALSESTAIEAMLVEGTVFAEAKTISDIFIYYKNALISIDKKARDTFWKAFLATAAPLGTLGATGMGAIISAYPINGGEPVSAALALIMGAFIGLAGSFAISEHFEEEVIESQKGKTIKDFSMILKKLSSGEIAKSLRHLNDPNSTDQIMNLLEENDMAKTLAVRQLLDQKPEESAGNLLDDKQAERPKSLPEGEGIAALPPAEESLSNVLAKAGLKAVQAKQAQLAGNDSKKPV